MEDLQLNISVPKKDSKKAKQPVKGANEYKFVSKPTFVGKTIARKRPQKDLQKSQQTVQDGAPERKTPKLSNIEDKSDSLSTNLRDLSQNKGKYHGKNYQDMSDDIQLNQKPRTGPWISSLFKNNPDVPRMGQRAVRPLVEKVFSGNKFSDLDIHPHSVANLAQNLKLTEVMTVQQQAIPIILHGRDVLIRSQTGSGKTLAYALPIIEGLQAIRPKIDRHDGIRVVIVIPTRELAVQTYELLVKLVKPFTWIVPGLLSGGQKRKAEKARLRKGLSILVGTPGRINDHLRHTQSLNFAKTGCLVLDEADRLLDMGYEKDVAAIVKAIEDHKKAATYDPMASFKQTVVKKIDDEAVETPEAAEKTDIKHHLTEVFLSKERQTVLLSATLTKAVENLAGITMVDPVFVDTSEGRAVVADSLQSVQTAAKATATVAAAAAPQSSDDTSEVNYKEPDGLTSKKKKKKKNKVVEASEDEEKAVSDVEVEESKRGLKHFSGAKHSELFTADAAPAPAAPAAAPAADSDSDSDSDYEFFKLKAAKERAAPAAKESDEEEDDAPDTTFQQALRTALEDDELVLPASVNQTFLLVPMKLRLVTLCALVVQHCVRGARGGKMIVFMATLEMVDYHADLLDAVLAGKRDDDKKSAEKEGESDNESDSESLSAYGAAAEGGLVALPVDVFRLHGSMPHAQRMEVFRQFRAARSGVLFCTDVAARGIDVPRVDLVLQYCAPASATDYVHRVGRTGRATQVGAAVLCLLPSEAEFVRYLEQRRIRLRQSDESACLAALQAAAPGAAGPHRAAIAVQARLEHVAASSPRWLQAAGRAFTSWVRFYSGYPREVRDVLPSRELHLGHAAKAFALRDAPAAVARRAKRDPRMQRARPDNRLSVPSEERVKRPGFKRSAVGAGGKRAGYASKQSSMHTASEFDSGLAPDHRNKKNKY